MQLWNEGLKCNLNYKPKEWIKILAIKANTAISQVHKRDQTYMRQLVTNNIQKLINKITLKERQQTIQWWLESQEQDIKHKIRQNQLIITEADKGIILFILHKEDYVNKIEEFIVHGDISSDPSFAIRRICCWFCCHFLNNRDFDISLWQGVATCLTHQICKSTLSLSLSLLYNKSCFLHVIL